MSAIAYGVLVRRSRDPGPSAADRQAAADNAEKPESKLVTAIAALVPAEIIAGHALILGVTTRTDDAGTTTITEPAWLGASLIFLAIAGSVAFLIGRGLRNFEPKDAVRLLLPAFAFVTWTAIMGSTSALTPWITDRFPAAAVVVAGVVVAVLLIAANARVNPAKPAES